MFGLLSSRQQFDAHYRTGGNPRNAPKSFAQMALAPGVEHKEAGVISGGEGKRAHICLELAAEPSLLLLDEPTSGLDTFVATKTLMALSEWSARPGPGGRPRCAYAVVHQPAVEDLAAFTGGVLVRTKVPRRGSPHTGSPSSRAQTAGSGSPCL